MSGERDMRKLLQEARNEIQRQYMAAGGDEEARTNANLAKTGKLIDRLDAALAALEREPGHGKAG